MSAVQKAIYDEMLKFKDIHFIGGHPMAGSEKTGYKSAKAHLFENAFYILTPTPNVTKDMVDKMTELVKATGAVPIVLDPDYHDYTVAVISHMPHIIASALVNTVEELDDDNCYMHSLAAGGFKDITRIASSSPEVWSSICSDKGKILSVLKKFKKILNLLKKNYQMTIVYMTFLKKQENTEILLPTESLLLYVPSPKYILTLLTNRVQLLL